MRSRISSLALVAMSCAAGVAVWCPRAKAQSSPAALAAGNPYLLLIRDPVVHEELKVTVGQKRSITSVTDQLDGTLLAIRGQSVSEGTAALQKLIADTQHKINRILTPAQQKRFSEILLRVQGIRAILLEEAAVKLSLTAEQKKQLQAIFSEVDEAMRAARSKAEEKETQEWLQQEVVRLREDEQRKVLRLLDDAQRGRLLEMVGSKFDISRLGKVAFKSPDIKSTGPWINSSRLSLADLQGKVVAVHFWTFG